MRAVYLRELKAYFNSLSVYIFLCLYLIGGGVLFAVMNLSDNSARTATSLCYLQYVLFFTLPLLTILLSGRGKDRVLLSAPISAVSITAGKFLAIMTVLLTGIAVSFIYPLLISLFGTPAWGEIAAAYVGLLLLSGAVISFGMLISALTSSRTTAAATTYGTISLILFMQAAIPGISNQWLRTAFLKATPSYHLYNFESGMPGLFSLVYFISITVFFLFLFARLFERRRWL